MTDTTERYLVFSGETYYPSGGFEDFKGHAPDIENAKMLINEMYDDWAQIVDIETRQVVLEWWGVRDRKTGKLTKAWHEVETDND